MAPLTSRRAKSIHHFFERQILVLLGAFQGLVNAGNPFTDGITGTRRPLHHQVIHKKTDQPTVGSIAVRAGHTHPHVILSRDAGKQVFQNGQQHGEATDTLPGGQRFQRLVLLNRKGKITKTGFLRCCGIFQRRQCQRLAFMLQGLLPVCELLRCRLTGQPLLLLLGKSRVLSFQRRKRHLTTITQRVIDKEKLLHEDTQRPGIAGNMMQGDHQGVDRLAIDIPQTGQAITQQPTHRQIKRHGILLASQGIGGRDRV